MRKREDRVGVSGQKSGRNNGRTRSKKKEVMKLFYEVHSCPRLKLKKKNYMDKFVYIGSS